MRQIPLEQSDIFVVGSMVLTILGIMIGAVFHVPLAFGVTACLVIVFLLAGWLHLRNHRLGWLLLFGLVTGILELWADWIHVEHFKSLVYTHYFGFKLLSSPVYMPVGWWLTSVQFGYIALRVREIRSSRLAVGLVALLGMMIPPWYEELAAPAKAWYYTTDGLMFSNTPLWIIVTYGG